MNIYDIISFNIKHYIDEFEKSRYFKENVCNMSVLKYISQITNITEQRLKNILSNKAKIRIEEIGRIADALQIPIMYLVDDTKYDDIL